MLGTQKKSFSIAYKLTTLSVLGLAVAVVTLTPYILHLNEGIRLAQRESEGLGPVIALTQLIQQIQQHRGLSAVLLGGNSTVQDARTAKQHEADTSADNVAALIQATHVSQLAVTWTEAAQDWRRLENDVTAKTLSAPESNARHVAVIAQALGMLDGVVDFYQLSLDSGAAPWRNYRD